MPNSRQTNITSWYILYEAPHAFYHIHLRKALEESVDYSKMKQNTVQCEDSLADTSDLLSLVNFYNTYADCTSAKLVSWFKHILYSLLTRE